MRSNSLASLISAQLVTPGRVCQKTLSVSMLTGGEIEHFPLTLYMASGVRARQVRRGGRKHRGYFINYMTIQLLINLGNSGYRIF